MLLCEYVCVLKRGEPVLRVLVVARDQKVLPHGREERIRLGVFVQDEFVDSEGELRRVKVKIGRVLAAGRGSLNVNVGVVHG